ncbi:hypothetical protein LWX53_04870 [bacterium]|nr:hypothetical protein [bacterium]
MKKLAVLFVAILVAVGSVSAASSNTLTVNGTVTQRLEVGLPLLANTTGTIAMTLNGTGAEATTGDITLRAWANRKSWKITFTSTNAGKLVSTGLPSIDYLFNVASPTLAGATISSLDYVSLGTAQEVTASSAKTPTQGIDFTLTAKVLGQAGADILYETGSYSDTITIAIAAN